MQKTKFVEVRDPTLEGKSPQEIEQTLVDDMAKFQADIADMEKKIESVIVRGMTYQFRPYNHLQFHGCGSLYGGSKILAEWFMGRDPQTLLNSSGKLRALELGAGAVGLIGAVLTQKVGADVVWTDRQAAAMVPLQMNLALNDIVNPTVERFNYIVDDPVAWANGRVFDLIAFNADAILFKVDDVEARGKEENEPDLGLAVMLRALTSLLTEGGRVMVGVGEYHELIPTFWEEAKTAGFRVTRVGDKEGRAIQDARYPAKKEFGVVRMVYTKN